MTTNSESGPALEADPLVDALRAKAKRNMTVGALWCIGGIVVTAATYAAAEGGGTYTVAWGAIIFGGIQFFRGLADMQRLDQEAPSETILEAPATTTVPVVETSTASPTSRAAVPPLSRDGSPAAIEPRIGSSWVWWGIALVLVVFFVYLAIQIKDGKLPW